MRDRGGRRDGVPATERRPRRHTLGALAVAHASLAFRSARPRAVVTLTAIGAAVVAGMGFTVTVVALPLALYSLAASASGSATPAWVTGMAVAGSSALLAAGHTVGSDHPARRSRPGPGRDRQPRCTRLDAVPAIAGHFSLVTGAGLALVLVTMAVVGWGGAGPWLTNAVSRVITPRAGPAVRIGLRDLVRMPSRTGPIVTALVSLCSSSTSSSSASSRPSPGRGSTVR